MTKYVFCGGMDRFRVFCDVMARSGRTMPMYVNVNTGNDVRGIQIDSSEIVILGSFKDHLKFEEIKLILRAMGYTGGFPGDRRNEMRFSNGGPVPNYITNDDFGTVSTSGESYMAQEQAENLYRIVDSAGESVPMPDPYVSTPTSWGDSSEATLTASTSGEYTISYNVDIPVPAGYGVTEPPLPNDVHQQMYREHLEEVQRRVNGSVITEDEDV